MEVIINWIKEDILSKQTLEKAIGIAIVCIVIIALTRLIKKIFQVRDNNQKKLSVYPIVARVIRGFVFFIGFCFVLEILGVSTTPLWTVASAVSVALGFGAQAVIKDIINGLFILTEDQFNVGDIVEISDKQGKVEEIGLRVTRLRDLVDGSVYIIPNGDISIVTNQTKDFMFAKINVPVPYDMDLNLILESLREIASNFYLEDLMIEKPDVLGVVSFDNSSMAIRVICKTYAHQNWAVERAMRAHFKTELEKRNIIIPFPTQTIHLSS